LAAIHSTGVLDNHSATKNDPDLLERYMPCKDCSLVRGYPYKRNHLVALWRPNFSQLSTFDMVAGRTIGTHKSKKPPT
jgi:hypothetical protein